MTVATTPSGGELDSWGGEDFGGLGMEDIGAGELTIPRIEILHAEGRFRDRNSKVEYDVLRAAILGVVKGRIMWAKEVDDGDRPQCRSNNFEVGFPQMRVDIPADKQFPWGKSNFNPGDYPPQADGLIHLPCASCKFKEWDVNGQKKPLCSELYMLPMMYEGPDGELSPGILTVKSSAVKTLKAYITPFKGQGRPMFTVMTEIGLQLSSRGSVKYSVPTFKRCETTERTQWAGFAEQYRSIRDFLQRDPRPQEDKDGGRTSKPTASAERATRLDEDDPWASAAPPPPPPGRTAPPSAPVSDLPF